MLGLGDGRLATRSGRYVEQRRGLPCPLILHTYRPGVVAGAVERRPGARRTRGGQF